MRPDAHDSVRGWAQRATPPQSGSGGASPRVPLGGARRAGAARWGGVPTLRRVPAAFECHRLGKRYGQTLALAGVDLAVQPGELVGLLGPNGAGKSTLVKIACGLVRPSDGEGRVTGEPAGSAAGRSSGASSSSSSAWERPAG